MKQKIAHFRYVYLGLGVIGLIFLFTPLVRGTYDAYNITFELSFTHQLIIIGAIMYPFALLIVNGLNRINVVKAKYYSSKLYDVELRIISVLLPLLAIISLLYLNTRYMFSLLEGATYTVWYYLLILYLIVSHGFNIIVSFKK